MNRLNPASGPYPVFGPSRGPGWWSLPGLLLTMLFILVAIAIVVVLVRLLRSGLLMPPNRPATRDADPEQILQQRLAQGEIDVAEFRDRLAALRQGRERPI